MDDAYFLELNERLDRMCDSLSSMDGNGLFDLVGEWNLIPSAHELYMLQYDQRSASVADNPILASPEQSTLTRGNEDCHKSPVPCPSQSSRDFDQLEEIVTDTRESDVDQREELLKVLEDDREMLRATYEGEYEPLDPDERSSDRLSHIQVEAFVQTLPSVVISSLGLDDLKCSICRSEYGKERGNNSAPASEFDQVFPGQDLREFPVELPCGHVFGDWCISIWLRGCRPPSCPVCRSSF